MNQSHPSAPSSPLVTCQLLKSILQTRIQNIFNHLPSSRCLYIHKQILNTINFIFDFKLQSTTIGGQFYQFIDDAKAVDVDVASNVVFFIYARPESMGTIGSMIVQNQLRFVKKQYFVYFVPLGDYLCEEELSRMGVSDKVTVRRFDFNFVPFTETLFSLQLPTHLTSIQAESCIVQGLLKLQFLRGAFKNIVGKGKAAKSILSHLQSRTKQVTQIIQNQQDQDMLIFLDRTTDLITPFLTGWSYECLLDEFLSINMNRIDIPAQILGPGHSGQTFLLHNKKDPVYSQLCSMNISQVPSYLSRQSQQLKQRIQQQKQQAQDYEALNRLNNTLMVEYLLVQSHQSLYLHIAQRMKSVQFKNSVLMESSILQGEDSQTPFRFEGLEGLSLFYPLQRLLGLVCLHSQVADQGRYYSRNQKAIVELLLNLQRVEQLPTVYNLVKAEILRETKVKNNWREIAHKFQLFPTEEQYDSYTDLNILYSALSVKTVDIIMKNKLDPQRSALIHKDTYFKGAIPKYSQQKTVYVLIIGGISYNQISCFKRLAIKSKKSIKILTTQILGHNQLVQKFMFDPFGR